MVSEPTLDDYFTAAVALAELVRRAFDEPGSVTGGELRTALERFEAVERSARA